MSNKTHLKIVRTKAALNESLNKLIEAKDLSDITVKELCETAGINRTTFYVHYDNLDDFIREIEEQIAYEMIDQLERLPYDDRYKIGTLNNIFDLLQTDRNKSMWILHPRVTGRGRELLFEYSQEKFISLWTANAPFTEEEAASLLVYIFTGAFGFLQKWYEDGCPEGRRDLFYRIVNQSLEMVHKTSS